MMRPEKIAYEPAMILPIDFASSKTRLLSAAEVEIHSRGALLIQVSVDAGQPSNHPAAKNSTF
jgi:hypothetical protein